tara:strand:- start:1414 stop:3216 length:1803 start_codon:yes stop_codon:yes gene_type:complete
MAAKFGLLIDAKTKGENNIKRLGNSMQGVEGKAKNLGMAVRGVGAAFKGFFAIAAVGGIVALGKSAIDTADAFGKLSTRTGIAADKLLAYVNAGKLADVSQSDLETGLRTLARTQVEASEGVATYADAYAKLGVTVKNQDGTLKNSDQLLSDIADRFQDLPNGPEKAAVAMDIFGRSGQKMITLLNGGSEALDEFGFELSENFARNSETFNDNLTKVGIEMERLKMQILDDLLPGLIELSEGFIGLTKTIREAAGAFAKFFGIGDEAMIQKNTILIQKTNKALAQYRRNLKDLKAETGPDFLGQRASVIRSIEATVAELERKREVLRNEINRATRASIEPSPVMPKARERFRQIIKPAKPAENKLNEPEAKQNRVTAAVKETTKATVELEDQTEKYKVTLGQIKDTLANQLTSAITGLIDGTKSLKESLSGLLKSFGQMFLQAGMKGLVDKIFPSAKGNVFAQNKIVPYANGGLVSRPTLSLMGEAGPEAVLPLKRGANGQLGVQVSGANMNEAMGRYARRGSGAAITTDDAAAMAGAEGGGSFLDVHYNVERINKVDYVTAAEFERGMNQAAKRGAELGRQSVYSDLVNKRSVRSRVGV